jgi:hypothetical protein
MAKLKQTQEKRQTYLVELILASLGVKDCRLVPVIEEMSCGDKAIPAFQISVRSLAHRQKGDKARDNTPLFPGPHATRILGPLSKGWTR